MPRKLPLPVSLLAITLVAGTSLLRASDSSDSDGYRKIPYKAADGKTAYIRVKKDADPLGSMPKPAPGDKYDPERIFSHTSSFADKSFSAGDTSLSKNDSADKDITEHAFVTKSYNPGASSGRDETTPNLNTHFSTQATTAYGYNFDEYNRAFAADVNSDQNKKSLFASRTSSDQGRTADIGGSAFNTYSSSLADKTYGGPEAEAIHRDLQKINDGLMQMKDLPNRPLTVDEVRALINHGFKPDTNEPPASESKPLNDPSYQPEPLRDAPPPGDTEDDKDDSVPPPGTIAQPPPENSEPLPNR
ncbi:MAG: hypothetical protein LV479_01840 [Methylacidiphilales bacterium]|nr:hypothetical protein [Candidatus Methylacidiphilales bacterium]